MVPSGIVLNMNDPRPEQLQKVAATSQRKKVVDDVPNFASGDATVLISKIG